VDLVPLPRDPFTRATFGRRQRMEYDEVGHSATFISVEDIILAKLLAYRDTGSDKHLRDARGVLAMQEERLDLEALCRSAKTAGVLAQFEHLLAARGEQS
jgi:hypothetical protein